MSGAAQFWMEQNGTTHITPGGKALPEGDWFPEYLERVAEHGLVVEFGCGPGRLAASFEPEHYIGLDINENAIAIARMSNPDHKFECMSNKGTVLYGPIYGDAILCHTVLLHVPDRWLDDTVGLFQAPTVYVSEMLGRHWRRENGDPPVFNRDIQEYRQVFKKYDYDLVSNGGMPYEHYMGIPMALLRFDRCFT